MATDGTYLYIADTGNSRIVKRRVTDLSYVAERDDVAPPPTCPNGACAVELSDIATDGTYLYVTNPYRRRIEKFTVGLKPVGVSPVLDTASAPAVLTGIATDGTNVFVNDVGNGRVVKLRASDLSYVSAASVAPGIPGIGGLLFRGIATDGRFVFVSTYVDPGGPGRGARLLKLRASDLSIAAQTDLANVDLGNSHFGLTGVATDGANVFVVGEVEGPIAELRASDLSLIASSDRPIDAGFLFPTGMATDGSYIYVGGGADAPRIVKIRVLP